MLTEMIKDVIKSGKKAKGRSETLKHLHGDALTRDQAIKAACYQCQNYYADGLIDCEIDYCALYPYFPYRGKKEELL
jgi:hypothetical protein